MTNANGKTLMDRVRNSLASAFFVQRDKIILSGVKRDNNLGKVVADYFESTVRDYPNEGLVLIRESRSGYRMY